jgi:sialate O-acetylesterase
MKLTALYVLLAFISRIEGSEFQVSPVFGDHMVLQQGMPVPVWGWAAPGDVVAVKFGSSEVRGTTDASGRWQVMLPPLKFEGSSSRLEISGPSNKITYDDVAVGEVWIGSGQSNMALPMSYFHKNDSEYRDAVNENLRLLTVPSDPIKIPQKTFSAKWQISSPESCKLFSCTLWHFGDIIQKRLSVPVGLVCAARGSQAIQVFSPSGGVVFNSAIAPIIPMAAQGILWYQGEANAKRGDGASYGKMFSSLITDWRGLWHREVPFYYVLLAPFSKYPEGNLPPVWEAQQSCLALPSTGMVVAPYQGVSPDNIHPRNKIEVARCLTLLALSKRYGMENVAFSGPRFTGMVVKKNKIEVAFKFADGLHEVNNNPLMGFELMDHAGVWHRAVAQIDGEKVVVSSDEVFDPSHVRYCWTNSAIVTLANGDGLLAAPFHSDGWAGAVPH